MSGKLVKRICMVLHVDLGQVVVLQSAEAAGTVTMEIVDQGLSKNAFQPRQAGKGQARASVSPANGMLSLTWRHQIIRPQLGTIEPLVPN